MNELSLMVSAFRGIIYYFFRNLWNRMKGEKMKKEKDSLDRLAGELDCSRREAFLMVRNAWMRSTIGDNPANSEESLKGKGDMADNRMFIRCKGCGAKVFLAKLSLGIGWMTVKSAEEKGEELYGFIQEHENCCGELDADIIGAKFYSHEFEPFEIDYEMRPDFGHRLCAIERNWLKDIGESEEGVTIKCRHKVDARLGEVAANPNDYATKLPVEVKRMLMVYRDDTRDFRKLAHNEPVAEWKQIVDAALQSARSETLNHYLETDMLWVDFLSDGTAIVFLGNHR